MVSNGWYITLIKGNEKKRFFLFIDGDVRDMTNGFGKLYTDKDFNNIYNDLIRQGYKAI